MNFFVFLECQSNSIFSAYHEDSENDQNNESHPDSKNESNYPTLNM